MEPPGTAPGSDRFITTPVYRHSRPLRDGRRNIGARGLRRKAVAIVPAAVIPGRRASAGTGSIATSLSVLLDRCSILLPLSMDSGLLDFVSPRNDGGLANAPPARSRGRVPLSFSAPPKNGGEQSADRRWCGSAAPGGPPRGRTHLRTAGDDPPRRGPAASRRPAAALGTASRRLPQLRAALACPGDKAGPPASTSHTGRSTGRAGPEAARVAS